MANQGKLSKPMLKTAERTWDIVRRISKKGPMTVQDIAKHLHCTVRTAARIMTALQHFEQPIPIYRRTEPGSKTFEYDIDTGQLLRQLMRERQ